MAWDTNYALDGFFMFGAPLNVTRYMTDPDDAHSVFGTSTDTTWVTNFMLDEDINVVARLIALMHGPIVYYPVVRLLRRSSATVGPAWMMEQQFYNSWLYSYGSTFVDPYFPAGATHGQVLGLACHKTDNPQINANAG